MITRIGLWEPPTSDQLVDLSFEDLLNLLLGEPLAEGIAIATVRMAEMAAIIELQPALIPLTKHLMELEVDPCPLETAQARIGAVLELFQELLGTQTYFAGEQFTLAEVVAGTMVHSLSMVGIAIDSYPNLQAWSEKLQARQSW